MENIDDLFGKESVVEESTANHRRRVRDSIERNPDFAGFADYELLEYLLFATIPRKDTKPLAKNLIQIFGSLSAVLHADYYELIRVDGVGDKTAHLLAHVLPIVVRAEYSRFGDICLTTPAETAKYLSARFLGQTKEHLLMTSLNINDAVIQTDEISSGSVDSATVDIMRILRVADRNGAKQIVLAHNHPGGTMGFSDMDLEMTARVISCCILTGIAFVDHFVFSGNKYVSMFGSDMLASVVEMSKRQCTELSQFLSK